MSSLKKTPIFMVVWSTVNLERTGFSRDIEDGFSRLRRHSDLSHTSAFICFFLSVEPLATIRDSSALFVVSYKNGGIVNWKTNLQEPLRQHHPCKRKKNHIMYRFVVPLVMACSLAAAMPYYPEEESAGAEVAVVAPVEAVPAVAAAPVAAEGEKVVDERFGPQVGFGTYQNGYGTNNYGVNSAYGNNGYGNTGFGSTGYGNTGFGSTGYGNQGYGNQGFGVNTGYGNTGYGTTGLGVSTGLASNTGFGTTGLGASSLGGVNTAYGTTGLGVNPGYGSTGLGVNTGYGSTGLGVNTGFGSTGLGVNTGFGSTGYGNTGLGSSVYNNGYGVNSGVNYLGWREGQKNGTVTEGEASSAASTDAVATKVPVDAEVPAVPAVPAAPAAPVAPEATPVEFKQE